MDTFIIAFILLSVSLAIAFMIRSNNTTKYGLLHESSVIYESGFKKFKEGSKAKIQINEQGKVIIFFSEDNYIILEPLNIIENTIKKIAGEKGVSCKLYLTFIYDSEKYDSIFTSIFSLDSLSQLINELILNEIELLQRNYNLENIPAHVIYYGGIKNANKTEGIILWEDDHSINLANWTIGNVTLLKENIIRYSIKGDLYNEIHITGGNTKAAKFGDVVGGALLAGEMGAAVQLGGKTSQLKTDNVIIDNRKTILEANIDGELRHIFFDSKVYDILLRGLPDKEISFVGNDNTKTSNTNIYDKLRELAKLKGEGIISEKEFQEKKTSLLNKL